MTSSTKQTKTVKRQSSANSSVFPKLSKADQLFRKIVWNFYHTHGRRELPWRKIYNPYHILVSELMLQQTQVSRVLHKYPEFLKRFPSIKSLAQSPLREVLITWQGLGYNRRAKYLHQCAKELSSQHKGFPKSRGQLLKLPGIGQSTAGALLNFAFNIPTPFIETNIRAVYLHHYFPRKTEVSDAELLPIITRTLDTRNPREWFYALMDYGVHLKATLSNPSTRSRHHNKQSAFIGSHRQKRSQILSYILSVHVPVSVSNIQKQTNIPQKLIRQILEELSSEDLIFKHGTTYTA